jgi:hypothetical protein
MRRVFLSVIVVATLIDQVDDAAVDAKSGK